jgi:glycosyltransferase involved in cell wall biosynthesis
MRVLLLTHVFPRATDDPLGAFLLHLTQQLANENVSASNPRSENLPERVAAAPTPGMGERVQVHVLAPHAPSLSDRERFGAVQVTRFHYAPDAQETLAYTGVMHERVARGIGGKIAFARFVWHYFRAAREAAKAFQPDVIHAHWWLPGGLVGALASRVLRVPLALTTHGTDVEQLRRARWAKPLARFVFRQARVVTCGSHYLRERLMELDAADAARVQVIPMPVNPLFTERDWRLEIRGARGENRNSKSEIRNSKFKILAVARLTKQKSMDTLIEALRILRGRGVDAQLQIVGDGDQRVFLEHKAREWQLDAFAQFAGMRTQNELPELYAQCDAFVLPSLREGMGLVLAEALLCGAPVIATDSGGVTDIVRDGETGLLFPERDANALADALEKYARDSHYATRLAQNGRAWVMGRFTPQRVAAQFLQAYELAVHA